mmetsp:Transcript_39423/g.95330  ORF Transcript_39423/g.95330 Transcript_39423/m.95330 type:complete len:140 (+) Transcript_39423:47-466(+)
MKVRRTFRQQQPKKVLGPMTKVQEVHSRKFSATLVTYFDFIRRTELSMSSLRYDDVGGCINPLPGSAISTDRPAILTILGRFLGGLAGGVCGPGGGVPGGVPGGVDGPGAGSGTGSGSAAGTGGSESKLSAPTSTMDSS